MISFRDQFVVNLETGSFLRVSSKPLSLMWARSDRKSLRNTSPGCEETFSGFSVRWFPRSPADCSCPGLPRTVLWPRCFFRCRQSLNRSGVIPHTLCFLASRRTHPQIGMMHDPAVTAAAAPPGDELLELLRAAGSGTAATQDINQLHKKALLYAKFPSQGLLRALRGNQPSVAMYMVRYTPSAGSTQQTIT